MLLMELRRSERTRKPKTIWEQKGAPSAARDPKITKKAARTMKETALKAVATVTLSENLGLNRQSLPELPDYIPPFKLQYLHSKPLYTALTKLELFQKFLTSSIVTKIVENTNSYVENVRNDSFFSDSDSYTREWTPVNTTDIWRYLESLLYMGMHIPRVGGENVSF